METKFHKGDIIVCNHDARIELEVFDIVRKGSFSYYHLIRCNMSIDGKFGGLHMVDCIDKNYLFRFK